MSMEAKAILPMLWLLASEDEDPVSGCIRDRYEKIAFRLRIDAETLRKVIDECVDAGFLEVIDDETGEPVRSPKQQVTDSLQNSYETVTPEYRDRDREQRQRQRTETDSCSERSPRSKPTDDSPVVHVLKPLTGKRTEVAITETQVGTFLQAYPGVDVHAELRRMNAWLEANPQRRKTANGALKFVNGWLSRVQDNAKPAASTGPPRKLSPAEIMAQALKEFAEEDD